MAGSLGTVRSEFTANPELESTKQAAEEDAAD